MLMIFWVLICVLVTCVYSVLSKLINRMYMLFCIHILLIKFLSGRWLKQVLSCLLSDELTVKTISNYQHFWIWGFGTLLEHNINLTATTFGNRELLHHFLIGCHWPSYLNLERFQSLHSCFYSDQINFLKKNSVSSFKHNTNST